jgi:hypothetical protein
MRYYPNHHDYRDYCHCLLLLFGRPDSRGPPEKRPDSAMCGVLTRADNIAVPRFLSYAFVHLFIYHDSSDCLAVPSAVHPGGSSPPTPSQPLSYLPEEKKIAE